MQVLKDPRPYELDITRLRNGSNRPYTSGLFYELAKPKQFTDKRDFNKGNYPTFTIDKEFDLWYDSDNVYGERYYWSMRRLYLEAEDPNEYDFAKSILGSWDHWQSLLKVKAIKERIDAWRDELQYLLTSKGCKSLIRKATDGDVNASKFIATKKWQDMYEKITTKKPDREESHEIAEDFERLSQSFSVINGGKSS